MLVLSRRQGERIHIGDDITISVVAFRGNKVRLGIQAPDELAICRGEHVGRELGTPRSHALVVLMNDDRLGFDEHRVLRFSTEAHAAAFAFRRLVEHGFARPTDDPEEALAEFQRDATHGGEYFHIVPLTKVTHEHPQGRVRGRPTGSETPARGQPTGAGGTRSKDP